MKHNKPLNEIYICYNLSNDLYRPSLYIGADMVIKKNASRSYEINS